MQKNRAEVSLRDEGTQPHNQELPVVKQTAWARDHSWSMEDIKILEDNDTTLIDYYSDDLTRIDTINHASVRDLRQQTLAMIAAELGLVVMDSSYYDGIRPRDWPKKDLVALLEDAKLKDMKGELHLSDLSGHRKTTRERPWNAEIKDGGKISDVQEESNQRAWVHSSRPWTMKDIKLFEGSLYRIKGAYACWILAGLP